MAKSRLYHGYIKAVSWLYHGYIMDISCLFHRTIFFSHFQNPFHATVLFLWPLKSFENLWISAFRGYKKRPVALNGLTFEWFRVTRVDWPLTSSFFSFHNDEYTILSLISFYIPWKLGKPQRWIHYSGKQLNLPILLSIKTCCVAYTTIWLFD